MEPDMNQPGLSMNMLRMITLLFACVAVMAFSSCENVHAEHDFVFYIDEGQPLPAETLEMSWNGSPIKARRYGDEPFGLKKKVHTYHCTVYDFRPGDGNDFSAEQEADLKAFLEKQLGIPVHLSVRDTALRAKRDN